MVRDHSLIPHIPIAQKMEDLDWTQIELRVFSSDDQPVSGYFSLPDGNPLEMRLVKDGQGYNLQRDPFEGKVDWKIVQVRQPVQSSIDSATKPTDGYDFG